MSEAFIGEIRMTSFSFAPRGWEFCNGQLLPIATNQALFSLLGTQYGGNGIQTFALPNLAGRVPLHAGNGYTQGQSAGEAAHALTRAEMPVHTHAVRAAAEATTASASAAVWAGPGKPAYAGTPAAPMAPESVGTSGSGHAHENMPPYLTINFVIATVGIFPARD